MINLNFTELDRIDFHRELRGFRGYYYVLRADHSVCVAKTCGMCHELLMAEEFNYSKSARYNLHTYCVSCNGGYLREYNNAPEANGKGSRAAQSEKERGERNKARTPDEIALDRERIHPDGHKSCKTCRVRRPVAEFHLSRWRGDGLSQSCITCNNLREADRRTRAFIAYWEANNIPLRCYLCDGPFEEIEHLIPTSLPHGDPGPVNTRPACVSCNRGSLTGKWDTPLEEYIWSVNHPTKTRGEILHEIVMSGTWPFSLTSPEEFIELSLNYEE